MSVFWLQGEGGEGVDYNIESFVPNGPLAKSAYVELVSQCTSTSILQRVCTES